MKPGQNPIYRHILDEIGKMVQIHPNYADLQNQLALLLMAEGKLERAEIHLLKAIRLNPKYGEAILNLGFLYMETKRWKKAEEIFLSEAKRRPRNGLLQHVLGILYLQTGRQKEAAARIRKAMRYHSHYRDYYREKGVWQRGAIRLDREAESALKRDSFAPLCSIPQLRRSQSC